jgi:hypothetical protein
VSAATFYGRPRQFVEADDLMCPGCNETVRPEPPGYSRVPAEARPAWSHRDGTPLCRRPGGAPAEPIEREVRRTRWSDGRDG